MRVARVVALGPALYLFPPGELPPIAHRVPGGDRPATDLAPATVPESLVGALARAPRSDELRAAPDAVRTALATRLDRPVARLTTEEWRRVRLTMPAEAFAPLPAFVRALAAEELARTLRSPAELLVTLAREEERLERAVGREQRAAEAMVALPGSILEPYLARWEETRATLVGHHRALLVTLEELARQQVPNLAAVVGPRVAARLVAAAGGVAPLGRMRAPRIQLLGSRRRPSPDRGPRYGLLYRAARMDDVPADRRGAYARSLAALAAIAVRADATTRSSVAAGLLLRRDRRVDELRRRRR